MPRLAIWLAGGLQSKLFPESLLRLSAKPKAQPTTTKPRSIRRASPDFNRAGTVLGGNWNASCAEESRTSRTRPTRTAGDLTANVGYAGTFAHSVVTQAERLAVCRWLDLSDSNFHDHYQFRRRTTYAIGRCQRQPVDRRWSGGADRMLGEAGAFKPSRRSTFVDIVCLCPVSLLGVPGVLAVDGRRRTCGRRRKRQSSIGSSELGGPGERCWSTSSGADARGRRRFGCRVSQMAMRKLTAVCSGGIRVSRPVRSRGACSTGTGRRGRSGLPAGICGSSRNPRSCWFPRAR